MLGKIEGRRRQGWQRIRWLGGITDLMGKFDQAPGVGDGKGSLASWSSWSHKKSNITEWLNWTILVPSPNSRMEKNQVLRSGQKRKGWRKDCPSVRKSCPRTVPLHHDVGMWSDRVVWCWNLFLAEGSPGLLTLEKPVVSAGGQGVPLGYYCRSPSVGVRGTWLPGTAIEPRAGMAWYTTT